MSKIITLKDKTTHAILASELDKAVDAYNTVVEGINIFMRGIAERGQESYEEKSEKWQESDAALDMQYNIQEWEGELEEINDDTFQNLPLYW